MSLPCPLNENDKAWLQRARAVEQFFQREGRFPPYDHTPRSGPRLGVWLNNQRLHSRDWSARTLAPWRRAWLDEHLPGWDQKTQKSAPWVTVLEDVVDAVAERQSLRLPTGLCGARSDVRIDSWLYRNRIAERDGSLSPDRRSALDARIPNWRDAGRGRHERAGLLADTEAELQQSTLDAIWLDRAKSLREFVDRTGELPRRPDTERGIGIGHFLNNCWRAARGNEGRDLPQPADAGSTTPSQAGTTDSAAPPTPDPPARTSSADTVHRGRRTRSTATSEFVGGDVGKGTLGT